MEVIKGVGRVKAILHISPTSTHSMVHNQAFFSKVQVRCFCSKNWVNGLGFVWAPKSKNATSAGH